MREKGRRRWESRWLLSACLAGCAGKWQGPGSKRSTHLDREPRVEWPDNRGLSVDSGPCVYPHLFQVSHRRQCPGRLATGRRAQLQLARRHVPSAEKPSLLRVKPSDPDDSYMVQKIEGASRHPRRPDAAGRNTASAGDHCDAIRQWITNGAPNTATVGGKLHSRCRPSGPADTADCQGPVSRMWW